jgi:DNA-binding transcriptional LysR family regulator
MPKAISQGRISRRLRFRDLEVLFAVVQHGSMAKAAAELGVTQPAVSEVIAELEEAFGVRLFDRSPHGVVPTIYGRALHKRGLAAFDELKQGMRDIGFLADPTKGDVRIGCPDSIAGAILAPIAQTFCREYPGIVLAIEPVPTPTLELPELHARKLDVVLARLSRPQASMLHLNPECIGLKALPIKLPGPSFPAAIVTLKNRTLTPAVELFLERLRTYVKSLA